MCFDMYTATNDFVLTMWNKINVFNTSIDLFKINTDYLQTILVIGFVFLKSRVLYTVRILLKVFILNKFYWINVARELEFLGHLVGN